MSNSIISRDNLVIVAFKAIQYFKIPLTKRSIEEQIKTHPDYPALKSVTDTLDHFSIKNYPVRVTQKEIAQIDQPFLAYTHQHGEELQFVEKQSENGFAIRGNSKKKKVLSDKEFFSIFSQPVFNPFLCILPK